jgi:hypothetical protein
METFLTTPWKELAEATTKEAADDVMDTIPVLSTLKNPEDAVAILRLTVLKRLYTIIDMFT